MTPAEAALKTLESLARIGKVEAYPTGKAVTVTYRGTWRGERIELQAVEGTLAEAIVTIGRQAAGRKVDTDKKGCLPGAEGEKKGPGGGG